MGSADVSRDAVSCDNRRSSFATRRSHRVFAAISALASKDDAPSIACLASCCCLYQSSRRWGNASVRRRMCDAESLFFGYRAAYRRRAQSGSSIYISILGIGPSLPPHMDCETHVNTARDGASRVRTPARFSCAHPCPPTGAHAGTTQRRALARESAAKNYRAVPPTMADIRLWGGVRFHIRSRTSLLFRPAGSGPAMFGFGDAPVTRLSEFHIASFASQ